MHPLALAAGQFFAGATLLLLGGDGVVRGASKLALLARLSPLFVGLTIVSLGTSAPELAVSIAAALRDKADITIGNVVGSNLFNLLMIVGVAALVRPLIVKSQIVRFDAPVMIAACVAVAAIGLDGSISRLEGLTLFASVIAYLMVGLRIGRREGASEHAERTAGGKPPVGAQDTPEGAAVATLDDLPQVTPEDRSARRIALTVLTLVLGVAALLLGCEWFVAGSVTFAEALGVPEVIIGLTIVSIGTSLPELVTSVAATLRGQGGIAIGNAIGSTTMNVLVVLGITAIIQPAGLRFDAGVLRMDVPVMIAAAVGSWLIYRTAHRISRVEGVILVLAYGGYTGWLISRV